MFGKIFNVQPGDGPRQRQMRFTVFADRALLQDSFLRGVCRVLGTQAVDILGTFGRIDQHEHVVILDLDYAGGNCGNLFSSDSEKKTESEDSDKTEKSKERKK